jgi:hypothetical protein
MISRHRFAVIYFVQDYLFVQQWEEFFHVLLILHDRCKIVSLGISLHIVSSENTKSTHCWSSDITWSYSFWEKQKR